MELLKQRPRWLEWCERIPPMENHNLQLQARTVRNPYPQMVNFLLKKYPDLRFQDCYVDGNDWSAGNDAYRDDHPVMQFVGRQLETMRTEGVSKKKAFARTEDMFRDRRESLEREQKVMMAMALDAGFKPMFTTGRAYLQAEAARAEEAHLENIRNSLRGMKRYAKTDMEARQQEARGDQAETHTEDDTPPWVFKESDRKRLIGDSMRASVDDGTEMRDEAKKDKVLLDLVGAATASPQEESEFDELSMTRPDEQSKVDDLADLQPSAPQEQVTVVQRPTTPYEETDETWTRTPRSSREKKVETMLGRPKPSTSALSSGVFGEDLGDEDDLRGATGAPATQRPQRSRVRDEDSKDILEDEDDMSFDRPGKGKKGGGSRR